MSSDTAATILFGDLRYSYEKQLVRVERLRAIAGSLEAQFLISVRERTTRPNSSVSVEEKKDHESLRRLLNRTRLQLSDEMDSRVLCAERTLSLLTNTYLANAEAVKANISTVIETVLSQRLFSYIGALGVNAETARRYDLALQKWIARVNSLAAGKTPDMRVAGAILMKQTALQSPAILTDNIAKWTTAVVGMLSKSDMASVTEAALQTALVFMDVVREVPILHREIANPQVPRINQAVLALAEQSSESTEGALETLMYSACWFPTLFRPLAAKTEALCLRILGDPTAKIKTAACRRVAQCMATLCAVGGKAEVEDKWFQTVNLTLGTIQHCIDHILCVEDSARETSSVQAFNLPVLDSNFIIGMPQAADRISRMTSLLVALFTRPLDADVPIPADNVVRVVSKLVLAPMLVETSKTPRAEHGVVPMLAPQLHREAIRMLAMLVFALESGMYPFLAYVARTVGTISTASIASPTTTVALYSLIRLYVERYGYGFVVCLPREILSTIIGDTQAQMTRKATVNLESAASGLTTSKKRGSAKLQKQGVVQIADDQSSRGRMQIQYTDVVYAALNAVQALLEHTPTVIDTEMRTQLDSRILELLMLEMVGGSVDTPRASRQLDAPYRALLCRCLQVSVLSPDPWRKAIVPHALAVFTAGLEDRSAEVRAICGDALMAIEPIIHSRLPAQLRGPDTDAGVEAKAQVPRNIFGADSGLSAALADAHLNSPLTERMDISLVAANEKDGDVASEGEPNKRHKRSTSHGDKGTITLSIDNGPAAHRSSLSSSPQDENLGANNKTELLPENRVNPQATDELTTQQSSKVKPTVVEDRSTVSKHEAQDGGNRSDSDDDIPDIVMEGSDSDDDEA
ncbi:hypothetical protein IWW48_005286 [Coemansia sp. RSA 1200]|nr:hypothetical protein IWW48_005286 [Coemansia sp. RSA 1200]